MGHIDSTDPWCIPTFTSHSSDNSESTLTLVFAPSYRLIADLTKTSCISSSMPIPTLSLVLSQKISLGPHSIYIKLFSFRMMLLLHPSQDKYSINCSSLRHKAKLHYINRHYSTKHFFHHHFHHPHAMLKKLQSSIAAVVLVVPLMIGTSIHRAHSAGIPNPSKTPTYFCHHWNSYSPTSSDQL